MKRRKEDWTRKTKVRRAMSPVCVIVGGLVVGSWEEEWGGVLFSTPRKDEVETSVGKRVVVGLDA